MIKLEELKEVRILWDWQEAVIPIEYIKKLQYQEVKKNTYEIECREVVLEMDLAYIKSHALIGDKEVTIEGSIQNKDIWSVELVTKNEKMILTPPSYRKEIYCGEKEFVVSEDAENLCETHQIEGEIYRIEWKEEEEKDSCMSPREWSIFFQKANLTDISNITHQLGIELVDRILFKNKEENLDVIKRIHETDMRIGKIYSIKKGYTLSKEYYPLHGLDIFILNAKNHSHHWNFNFILVPNLKKEEQSLYKVIEEGIPNEDTKNYFSRTMIVHEEKDSLQEDMLEYLNENLIFVTYQELNQIWYEIHKEWNLL